MNLHFFGFTRHRQAVFDLCRFETKNPQSDLTADILHLLSHNGSRIIDCLPNHSTHNRPAICNVLAVVKPHQTSLAMGHSWAHTDYFFLLL